MIVQRQKNLCKEFLIKKKLSCRQSQRIVSIFSPPTTIDPKWPNVGCVIKVERSGLGGQEPYHRIGYYISSLSANSRRLAQGIRGHWLIENRLHWVKDVIYEEDQSLQKAEDAPINLSLLKTWVLTLLRILRKWEQTGELVPERKSRGGTRFYDSSKLLTLGVTMRMR